MSDPVDRNVPPDRDTPKWSETRWHGCWNPDQGVGLYLHLGRFRHDLDLWWVQLVAYLPGGRLAVQRCWGRQRHDHVLVAGGFELEQLPDGWRCVFDGAAQLTWLDPLLRAPQGAAAPAIALSWQLTASAVAPVWDLYAGTDERQVFAGDTHLQQAFATRGELTAGGQRYSLRGVGFKDHSSGTRTWENYGGHNFLLAVLPDQVLHAIALYHADGASRVVGALHRGGRTIPVTGLQLDRLVRLPCPDDTHHVTVELADGERLALRVRRLHEVPITVADSGDNLTGVDWHVAAPATVIQEAVATVTTAEGVSGTTFFERGAPRDSLRPPPAETTRATPTRERTPT